MAKNKKPETLLQLKLADYIQHKYPDVLFDSSMAGIRLTIPQASQSKQLRSFRIDEDGDENSDSFPDLMIFQPYVSSTDHLLYCGFFLEIKAEGVVVVNKNGTMRKDSHLQDQLYVINKLRDRGYYADFGIGWEDCKEKVDSYINESEIKFTEYKLK